MIFETHAHYDDESFDGDREEVISSLPFCGIKKVINVASSLESCKSTQELAEQHDFVYAAVGVHPSDIADLNEERYDWLSEQAEKKKVVAVGEIGLDYYWDKEEKVQERQRYWFRRQLALAEQKNLPVIIHSRDAAQDTMQILKELEQKQGRGVIHCYS